MNLNNTNKTWQAFLVSNGLSAYTYVGKEYILDEYPKPVIDKIYNVISAIQKNPRVNIALISEDSVMTTELLLFMMKAINFVNQNKGVQFNVLGYCIPYYNLSNVGFEGFKGFKGFNSKVLGVNGVSDVTQEHHKNLLLDMLNFRALNKLSTIVTVRTQTDARFTTLLKHHRYLLCDVEDNRC